MIIYYLKGTVINSIFDGAMQNIWKGRILVKTSIM